MTTPTDPAAYAWPPELATALTQLARIRALITTLTSPADGYDMNITEQVTRLHVAGLIETALNGGPA